MLTSGRTTFLVLDSGKIQYTPSIEYWSPNSIFLSYQNSTTAWSFSGQDVLLQGGGTIDGNGKAPSIHCSHFQNLILLLLFPRLI